MGAIFNTFKSDVRTTWNGGANIVVGLISLIIGSMLLFISNKPIYATTTSGMPFFTGNYELQYNLLIGGILLLLVFVIVIAIPGIRYYYNSLKKRAGVE